MNNKINEYLPTNIEIFKVLLTGVMLAVFLWIIKFLFKKAVECFEKHKRIDVTKVKILFIDDHAFRHPKILKDNFRWNVESIKDIEVLDSPYLKEYDIFFIDINGVAKKLFPEDQGIGLGAYIKDTYKNKRVCIYSSNPPADSIFKMEKIGKIDKILDKNSAYEVYHKTIENFYREIR